jgi:hypothetical protein
VSVAIITSVSENIRDVATLTLPNKAEYCLRHGYSLVADNQPYETAVHRTDLHCHYLDRFDLIWTLDADTILTNMAVPIHSLACLGPHVTVCEEGIVAWNRLNCGSMVWRNTTKARRLLQRIADDRDRWAGLACGWQTFLGTNADALGDVLTVAPLRSFNSCVWNRPANSHDEIGGHWQAGDLVYHPCGVFPREEKLRWLSKALGEVQR